MGLFGVSKDTTATNNANKEINQQNIDASYEMLRRQQEYADKQWERDTTYNSPSAQAQRYRAAGMNPYFMMSHGNTNTATSQSGGSGSVPAPIPMQNPAAEKQGRLTSLNNSINSLNESIQGIAQRRNMDADSNLKNAQADSINISNGFLSQEKRQGIAESVARVRRIQTQNDKDNFDIEFGMRRQPYDLQKMQNDTRLQARQEKLLDLDIQMANKRLPFISQYQAAMVASIWQNIEESKAREEDYKSAKKLKDAEKEVQLQEKESKRLDNLLKNFSEKDVNAIKYYIIRKYESDSYTPGIQGSGISAPNLNRSVNETFGVYD